MPDRHFRPLECKPFALGRKPELAHFGLAQPEFGFILRLREIPYKKTGNTLDIALLTVYYSLTVT